MNEIIFWLVLFNIFSSVVFLPVFSVEYPLSSKETKGVPEIDSSVYFLCAFLNINLEIATIWDLATKKFNAVEIVVLIIKAISKMINKVAIGLLVLRYAIKSSPIYSNKVPLISYL